jgi:hypothetical protein
VRTWDDNKAAMNQLWPTHIWQEEERKLLNEDLSPLDQDTLYDAIRNVKRHHDTPFVHLKWLLDEYRILDFGKRRKVRRSTPAEPKLQVNVKDERDAELAEQFITQIDDCLPADFVAIQTQVLDALPEMHAASAIRVLGYARARLLGQVNQFSQVSRDGSLKKITFTKEGWK